MGSANEQGMIMYKSTSKSGRTHEFAMSSLATGFGGSADGVRAAATSWNEMASFSPQSPMIADGGRLEVWFQIAGVDGLDASDSVWEIPCRKGNALLMLGNNNTPASGFPDNTITAFAYADRTALIAGEKIHLATRIVHGLAEGWGYPNQKIFMTIEDDT